MQAVPYAIAETPAPFVGNATLIDYLEAVWTHREGPSETDPLWASPEFTPGADWGEGEGFLGFGLPNGVYPAVTAPLDQGSASYYLRTTFDWNFDSRGVALLADLYLSDGAMLWLNGREVRRVRMPDGDITAATPATGETTNPGVVETFSLPVSALAVGANLLAVELHQAPGSLDTLGFGLSLRASDNDPPAILNPALPEDREVVEGQGTVFSAGAVSGTEPFAYQWFKDGALLFGEESPQLEIPRVLVDDAGVYAVEIKNGSDTVRSRDAVLTTVAEPVAFTNASAPADRTVKEGLATTFEAPVTGSPEFRWQWYKDNAAIDGQNGPVLSFDAVQLGDEGAYHVVVSNRVNPVTSRQARLDVTADSAAAAVEFVTGGSGRIVVRFSEPVEQASALDPRSYILPGVAIQELSLSDDGRTVTLLTGAFPFGEVVPLRVEGVKDLFGNATSAAAPFRATILIDGDFSDWTGIAPAASDPSDLDEGGEFKDYWIANDGEHLYLRFSFHRGVGQLPVNHFYQIYFDADNDPGTGLQVGGIGSSMMIENGLGWLQRGGGFNEGGVGATGFLLAPQFGTSEFECRISLASAVNADRSPVFTGDTVAVSFVLMTSSWAVVDRGPVETTIVHSLAEWLPPTASAPFAITSLTRDPADRSVSVTWSATADGVYAVETSADLRDWEEVDDGLTSEGEPEASYGFVGPAGSAPLYVRIRKL